jgi:plastocyanin
MDLSRCTHLRVPLLGSVLAAGALATATILAGAHPLAPGQGAAPETAGAREAAVTIDNFSFTPPVITVGSGTRIVRTNRDDTLHAAAGTRHRRPVLLHLRRALAATSAPCTRICRG